MHSIASTTVDERAKSIKPLYHDAAQPIERRVDDLLGRMTLEEKVGQINMPCVYEHGLGKTIPEKTEGVQKFAAGTLIAGFGPGGGFFTLSNEILHDGHGSRPSSSTACNRSPPARGWAFPSCRAKRARTA